ncbi:excisionase [Paraburkholderia unamae]|uniref:excisionase n=1 Tax=Paraburkholderia unamae TaxID=219649 RepID=UPI003CC66D1D
MSAWASSIFGEHCPCRKTLYTWITEGNIAPLPQKIGRSYFCQPDARYVSTKRPQRRRESAIKRMIDGR